MTLHSHAQGELSQAGADHSRVERAGQAISVESGQLVADNDAAADVDPGGPRGRATVVYISGSVV